MAQPSRSPEGITLRLVTLLLLVGVAILGWRVHQLEQIVRPVGVNEVTQPLVVPRGKMSDLERATVELFEKASASVVHITTASVQHDFFRLNVFEIPQGTGSGFAWDAQGHIVTNYHVVQTADSARVTLPDHSVYSAQLVGLSARHDLAVLRIPGAAAKLQPLPIGTSDDLAVGQQAIAIGSPFGLDYTLSTGVVSGLGREIPGAGGLPIRGAIQTDAAINPGNSGGPLLDSSGRLIGVNTSIISPSGASAGVGFAVPIDTVARVVPDLIRYGREVRPVIGVELASDGLARRFRLQGALVLHVTPGSGAEKAGMRGTRRDPQTGRILLGDLIIGIDDNGIATTRDVHLALDERRAGETVKVTVAREGKPLEFEIVLGQNVE
jgi:S1-C subfamily serine protease